MNTLMATAAVLANASALSAIYAAETNKRRNSAIFLTLLMAYGVAHALTSTEYVSPALVDSDSAIRYARIDYTLVLLFIFFSDEFHALDGLSAPTVALICVGFLLSDAVHLLSLSAQWARLVHCTAQCVWRYAFFRLVRQLQERIYSK